MLRIKQAHLAVECSRGSEITEELFLEMLRSMATSFGLRAFERLYKHLPRYEHFTSTKTDLNFEGTFRENLTKACMLSFSDPAKIESILRRIEECLQNLLYTHGEVEVVGLGVFGITRVPVWTFQVADGLLPGSRDPVVTKC